MSFNGIVYFLYKSFQHKFWCILWVMLKKSSDFHSHQHFWLPKTEKCNLLKNWCFKWKNAFLLSISSGLFFFYILFRQAIREQKNSPLLFRRRPLSFILLKEINNWDCYYASDHKKRKNTCNYFSIEWILFHMYIPLLFINPCNNLRECP